MATGTTAIRAPTPDIDNHQIVLSQLKETTEIAQRQRGNPGDSFVKLSELIAAGIVNYHGNVVSANKITVGNAAASKGPAGPIGPAGPAGGAGTQVTTTFVQSSPATTWVVSHGLGRFPSVSVVDSANSEVDGDLYYIDSNNLVLTFSAPFSGEAYLN